MLDTILTFLNDNQIIAAVLVIAGLASPIIASIAAIFLKKSNLNLKALNEIDVDNNNLKKELIAAKSQLSLYDPSVFIQRLDVLNKENANQSELQIAAEEFFKHQNKAITSAAVLLAQKALLNEAEDGIIALHQTKRWLKLGLAATPRHQYCNELLVEIDERLNAIELDLPKEVVEIDLHLSFGQISIIAHDLILSAQYPLAELYVKRGIDLARQNFSEPDENYSSALSSLGSLRHLTGHLKHAELIFRKTAEISRQTLGETHPDFYYRVHNLASVLSDLGSGEEAMQLFEQALEISGQTFGIDHPNYGKTLNNIAKLFQSTGHQYEAERLFRDALEIFNKTLPDSQINFCLCLHNLSLLLKETCRDDEAKLLIRQALKIAADTLGDSHPHFVSLLINHADILREEKQYKDAEPLIQRALAITRATVGEDHLLFASCVNSHAKLLQETGDFDGVAPLFEKAVSILENLLGPEHQNTITVGQNLKIFLTEHPPKN